MQVGESKNGNLFNCTGTRILSDGSSFEGTWVEGKEQGKCKMTYLDETYVGRRVEGW